MWIGYTRGQTRAIADTDHTKRVYVYTYIHVYTRRYKSNAYVNSHGLGIRADILGQLQETDYTNRVYVSTYIHVYTHRYISNVYVYSHVLGIRADFNGR